MQHEQLLFIDIETVPQYASFQELTPAMQLLWKKKANLLNPDELPRELFEERGGIYAEFGKIICIGLGYFFQEETQWQLKVKTIYGDDEKKLLQEFTRYCAGFLKSGEKVLCGHNIREFDIPYICRRMLVQGETLPLLLRELQAKKPWENTMLDTMQFWKFGEYKNFVSVELLAEILGIPTPKDDIYGGDVARVYWKEGNLNRIVTYCNKDIVTVAQLYLRLQGLPLLNEDQIQILS
jgi:hypothetical protein